MSLRLLFHPKAEEEYKDAYQWYENEQKGLGDRFEKFVEQKIQEILLHPDNYRFSKGSYREASVDIFPYTIVYKFLMKKKLIYVSSIYHAKRNPKHKYRK